MDDGGKDIDPNGNEDVDYDMKDPLLPYKTDDGWTKGRSPRSHTSSTRHQYETKKGSSAGFANPSYEGGEEWKNKAQDQKQGKHTKFQSQPTKNLCKD